MAAASSRRAVLTGIGVLTPIGKDPATFWTSLQEGRSGVRPISVFDASGLPVRFAGEISDFDAKRFVTDKNGRRALKVMARTIQLAVSGAELAIADGAVNKDALDKSRFGVEFGAGLVATELPDIAEASRLSVPAGPDAVDLAAWGTQGLESIPPLWMLKYLPNMLACHTSIFHDAQGPSNSITESDVASLLAFGEAFRNLQRDAADFFLVGGAESKLNPLSMVRQCLFEPLSRRHDQPEKACRPFDRDRDGLVLGEGAVIFCMEDLEHARRRGAKVLAEVVGFGASFDRRRDGEGLARAIKAALTEANIGPEDVDHVNAHGLATKESDLWEARAIQKVFGGLKEPVPVFAAKSYFGNLGAGGAAIELAASVLGMQHGLVPATLNRETPDPECRLNVIAGTPRPMTKPYVVKVGFTQMGQCAALVIRKP